jgi:class 3 adenylate cyclase
LQPGTVGLRGELIAAWETDLRAVRQDTFDVGRSREALLFTQRFYGLISALRPSIQHAWGLGGHVHVVDSAEVGGPGPRVSQSRIRLRNHGDAVQVELFSYADGASRANPSAGLDRSIRVVDVDPLLLVNELYRTAVDFLSHALNIDLLLGGSAWLYEHVAANHFVTEGSWPSVGEVYRRATREFAVADSFENAVSQLAPVISESSTGSVNGNGSEVDDVELRLSIERLNRLAEPHHDLESFLHLVHIAVAADQADEHVASASVAESLSLDELAITKLGRLAAFSPDVCRDGTFSTDYASWRFLPSYNVHFFRRAHTIDDFLAVEAQLLPRAATEGTTTTSPGATAFKVDEGATLPDGIVTFLMTDVVESTPLWLASRASMYQAMRRHDQVLTSAIEANGGIVLKERGEGDSFFAVFLRATDAVVAAVDGQAALQAEPWPERIAFSVRMAVLTGEADAADRDYRSPAVNRCAKLRRRAVGGQILVSETTYSIVADILRADISLVGVGKRRLEGHDRPEEVYVVRHPEVSLKTDVAEDATEGIAPG